MVNAFLSRLLSKKQKYFLARYVIVANKKINKG